MIMGPMMDTMIPIVCWFIAINTFPPCENIKVRQITKMGPAVSHALLQRGFVHFDPPHVDPNLEAMQ
jgi:hypothetical protein